VSDGPLVITDVDELHARAGSELGVSAWHRVTQAQIDAFAQLTGDDQWIHVDPARAAVSPFGTTIAHGLFTLALGPKFHYSIVSVQLAGFGLNYGYDRVRFPAPLPAETRVRMRLTLRDVATVPNGLQIGFLQTFEGEGMPKPVCVAEILSRYVIG
jgi:acyl dehydratase